MTDDIELVIKIPKKIYKHIKSMQICISGLRNGKSLLKEILKAIHAGTPLPKGHGRLIDRDELMRNYGNPDVEILLDNMDTIIEADEENKDADSN